MQFELSHSKDFDKEEALLRALPLEPSQSFSRFPVTADGKNVRHERVHIWRDLSAVDHKRLEIMAEKALPACFPEGN